jgi:hypothetical protein
MQPIGISEVNAVLDPTLLPGQRQRIIRFWANLVYRCFDNVLKPAQVSKWKSLEA